MAVLHVKSPDGTSYNMTIVTSGTTESLQINGWCKLPNGLIMQWLTSKWEQYLPGYVGEISFHGSYPISLANPYSASCIVAEKSAGGLFLTHYRIHRSDEGVDYDYSGNIYSLATFNSCSFLHIVIGYND